jgi:hypothetical protein
VKLTSKQYSVIPVSAIFDIITYGRQDEPLGTALYEELTEGPWTFGDLDAALVSTETFIDWLDTLFGRDIAALVVDEMSQEFRMEWVGMYVDLEA